MTSGTLLPAQDVAVIGAGTMGAGIALVAARAGHRVRLHDAVPGAAERGLAGIAALLDRDVAKGRLAVDGRAAVLGRILAAPTIESLAPSLPGDRGNRRGSGHQGRRTACGRGGRTRDAILATNTSFLSVTALAARMQRPGRAAGMHFFNPAPVLPLVEVVSGHATEPDVADAIGSGTGPGDRCRNVWSR